ncbi:MAG: hypothetical protein IKA76_02585 [Clostridia bacterium]|nr:hypothetical protein [Clostridia bacterium]
MFGYVRVHHPELKVKEYEFYKGTYCGLCRSMGKCTGQCSRMTLSYDFAFLALMRIALTGDKIEFSQGRCMAHPIKKRNYMKHNESLAYCAGAAAILNYHKLMDDLADEKGFRRLRAVLARPFIAHARKKALKAGLSELDRSVAERLGSLSQTEKEQHPSVDLPARIFGEILSDIMRFGIPDGDGRIAASAGLAVGKWIYIADALDDAEEDAKKSRYNPFLLLYGRVPTPAEQEGIRNALKNQLFEAEAAIDLMDFENPTVKSIIDNILYLGMPLRIEQISKDSCDKPSKKRHKKGHKEDERSL